MKNVNDVAIYAVLAVCLLLAFRSMQDPAPAASPTTMAIAPANPLLETQIAQQGGITVTGTAEMLVPPDEIMVEVRYREYKHPDWPNRKIEIKEIEDKIMKAIKDAKVPAKQVTLSEHGWNRYWDYWHYWYDRENMLVQKHLSIQVSSADQLHSIIENLKSKKLRKEGILSIKLGTSSHSKIEEYRETVKIRAMQAAQDKAAYLLTAVGEKRGRLVNIRELEDPKARTRRYGYGYWGGYGALNNGGLGVSNVSIAAPRSASQSSGESDDPGLQPIRLQYGIEATFAIRG